MALEKLVLRLSESLRTQMTTDPQRKRYLSLLA